MASKYTKELLEPVVSQATCIADVLRRLGLQPTGGNYRYINARIRAHGLDTRHFTGSGWSRGKTSETSDIVRQISRTRTIPDDMVFVANSPYTITNPRLTKRLLKAGWPYRCFECGLTEWLGRRLTLHLDHINGINNDHRVENLRLLCPNCHQQTETWGNGANRCKRKASASEDGEQRP